MQWKNALSWKTALAVVAVLVVAVSTLALASPINYTVQQIECKTCVISDSDIECWDTCSSLECTFSPPGETPEKNETPIPPDPTPKPEPTPTDPPDPVEQPKCNRGLGNGSEECDPGNSSGKPGKAGEGDG